VRRCFVVLFVASACMTAKAQQDSVDLTTYVHSPRPLGIFDANLSLGFALTVLPQPLVETELPAPAVDLRFRVGLPLNLALVGRASSNVATNYASGGMMWSVEVSRLTVGAGLQAGYLYGSVTFLDGFDTDVQAVLANPFGTAGIRFDDFTLSGKLELEYVLSQRKRVESLEVEGTKRTFNGAALTLSVEQPFWKRTHIALGVTLNYTRNPYQAWVAFNTFDDFLFYPELFAGFLL
jgi:hypothetical protein